MAYREEIAVEIQKLVEKAPAGVSSHHLKDFKQQDVVDTVNRLHLKYPKVIRDTFIDHAKYATIEIEK
ncbi:hypothetical protein [Halalkalibacter hemicellulosilyticus]|uniref:Uncharacterized protein n=1 Tax=Halalkalibacter hemicellulosilyticusJCM 9152 TaxID=1236971 RepID=W4QKK2_9BACI|nr:hypothetical protein [Halalkalibacter hemicellulosilyticus]GAE32412.1 hypothetical protein JCM9152_3946 [Halalkalibacter hemicellulosilyticusJCM 9152]